MQGPWQKAKLNAVFSSEFTHEKEVKKKKTTTLWIQELTAFKSLKGW